MLHGATSSLILEVEPKKEYAWDDNGHNKFQKKVAAMRQILAMDYRKREMPAPHFARTVCWELGGVAPRTHSGTAPLERGLRSLHMLPLFSPPNLTCEC